MLRTYVLRVCVHTSPFVFTRAFDAFGLPKKFLING